MAKISKRYAIVFILIALTTFAVNDLQSEYTQMNKSGLEAISKIPMRFNNEWQGRDFPLEERVYDLLETRAIIHRSYTNKTGDSVFLSIVYYGDMSVPFHSPEDCFIGQGLMPEKSSKIIVLKSEDIEKSIKIVQLVTTNKIDRTVAYYFFKAGNFSGRNYVRMRLNIAANKLFNDDPRASLIRVSTALEPGKEESAESLLVQFLQEIFPYVNSSL